MSDLDQLCINSLRFLAVDSVEQARSGHPGLPLGAAPMAYVLWDRRLRHNPANPRWWNRDRFVLSAGHGSALLYALLHATGYDLTLEDLKQFRQMGSRTPGHPEYRHTPGVEATTGPLGQGFAMGVGMALAEEHLAARFNREGFPLTDHFTYGLVSDGDLMEGIASEAASLAGHLGLGKLVYLYDDNHISLEGSTELSFTENVPARFEAYGWRVLRVADGNDVEALDAALQQATSRRDRPTLIQVRTHIGYGSPRQDTKEAHGEPLGPENTRATKTALGFPVEPPFYFPEEARTHLRKALERGRAAEAAWDELFSTYQSRFPSEAEEFERTIGGRLPENWSRALPAFAVGDPPLATREASEKVMNAVAAAVPLLIGGSADLAPSTKTLLKGMGSFDGKTEGARNLHFGVRENAMVAIVNGMALHGGLLPYGATFFVFSDYARPSLRLSALMGVHSLFIFTHDSVWVGEDGPTHQPIEHLASLRAMPGMTVIRPADANEVSAAWRVMLERKGPVSLVLSRQKLPVLEGTGSKAQEGVARGAYVLSEPAGAAPRAVLLATGSEVVLALTVQKNLATRGIGLRVVSMPSWELFEEQTPEYRGAVLLPHLPRVSLEAASTMGWSRYVGDRGVALGIDRFGASGPGNKVAEHLGMSASHVEEVIQRLLGPSSEGVP
jgi:transketolase